MSLPWWTVVPASVFVAIHSVICVVSPCLLRGSGWLWLLSETSFASLLQATGEPAIV